MIIGTDTIAMTRLQVRRAGSDERFQNHPVNLEVPAFVLLTEVHRDISMAIHFELALSELGHDTTSVGYPVVLLVSNNRTPLFYHGSKPHLDLNVSRSRPACSAHQPVRLNHPEGSRLAAS